jgi:NAD(P)H-dependent flavin oxidoreductase YrpB (nitropropane dioxygenase family)
MIRTALTERVGVSVPIQLAAMPGVVTPELLVAVADAGALAMLPATMLSATALEATLAGVLERTRGQLGVNFLIPFLDRACVPVAAAAVRVVEFFYGTPDAELIAEARAQGALASWQVGRLAEAIEAERAGADLIVAQGTEAGGHVHGQTSLFPLLSEVVDAVGVPVIAAGGIATARDLAAALASGAAAARMGTRFVASTESGAHPDYVAALLGASASDTCLTEAFSVLWPNETRFGEVVAEVPRLSPYAPSRETTGEVAAMALYAGESVENVRSVLPAARLIAELVAGAERLLART